MAGWKGKMKTRKNEIDNVKWEKYDIRNGKKLNKKQEKMRPQRDAIGINRMDHRL